MSAREDDARVEGYALCEEMVAKMLEAMAEEQMRKWTQHLLEDGKAWAFALQGAALAVRMGQHRTDEYDADIAVTAHRRILNRAQASAGGKASARTLTPEERRERAQRAARKRWAGKRGQLERAVDAANEAMGLRPGTKN